MISFRVSLLGAVLGLALTVQAHAGPKKLIAAEITEELSGNTLDGDWDGVAYRQYFGSSGQTTYATQGEKSVNGSWRVTDSDQLCETLPPTTNEICYDVLRTGITIFLVTPNTGLRHRAILIAGNALDFSIKSPY
jgi:hypothetical protein